MVKKAAFVGALGFSILVLIAFLCQSSWAEQAVGSLEVSIQELSGDVQIIKAGETTGRPAAKGDVLEPKDKIQTGRDGKVSIAVEGAGEINLSKETTWSFEKYSVENGKADFSAQLALGRLKAKVQKLPEGSLFQIKTPTSVAAVRGTFFGLFVYMVEQQFFTMLEVFEDAVVFSNLSGEESYAVSEGQSASATEAGDVTPPQTAGVETDKAVGEEKLEESAPVRTHETPQGDQTLGDFSQPPETIQESQPGQPEFEQETQAAQNTVTGAEEKPKENTVGSGYP